MPSATYGRRCRTYSRSLRSVASWVVCLIHSMDDRGIAGARQPFRWADYKSSRVFMTWLLFSPKSTNMFAVKASAVKASVPKTSA